MTLRLTKETLRTLNTDESVEVNAGKGHPNGHPHGHPHGNPHGSHGCGSRFCGSVGCTGLTYYCDDTYYCSVPNYLTCFC